MKNERGDMSLEGRTQLSRNKTEQTAGIEKSFPLESSARVAEYGRFRHTVRM